MVNTVIMVKTVIFDYRSPNCDHDLKDSKPFLLHDTSPSTIITSLYKRFSG